ncbi:hypothetical protein PENDEC_c026G06285 [Penicillium decumbens]|jgi:hypothetical protein
MLTN